MEGEHTPRPDEVRPIRNRNVYLAFVFLMQFSLVVGLAIFVYRRDWEDVFLTLAVIGLTLLPPLLRRHYQIVLPAEFHLIAVAFVYLSLFLGSARDFYYRFWWWDIVLHMGSGFLLGIIGFLAVFVLNRTDRIPPGIQPSFLAFFSVTFAVFVGVLWEIFEFTVDQIWPHINMQSTETGVVDTMHDLIVDTLGAVIVAFMGWTYLKTGRYAFVADGVRRFIRKNPHLFDRPREQFASFRQRRAQRRDRDTKTKGLPPGPG